MKRFTIPASAEASLTLFSLVGSAFIALAAAASAAPQVSPASWRGLKAFEISNGRCTAVVVPELGGRVVEFGLAGGANWIWSGPPGAEKQPPTQSWGGDKTYIGPHTLWNFTQTRTWPPPSPDREAHAAELIDDGNGLRTTSPPWPGYDGARIVREHRFSPEGDFVIEHRISAIPESRAIGAIWTITQIVPPRQVYVPLNPVSPYKDHFYLFDYAKSGRQGMTVLSPALLRIEPVMGDGFKIAAHPAVPALAAVKEGLAFVQRADPQEGQYPEGADQAGFSVEVYHHDAPGDGQYLELEFLSPLRRLDGGVKLTTRWNIQPFPESTDFSLIEKLLMQPSAEP